MQVRRDLKDLKARLVLPELSALTAQQGPLELASPARLVLQDPPELLDQLGYPAQRVLPDPQAQRVPLAQPDLMEPLALQENRALLV